MLNKINKVENKFDGMDNKFNFQVSIFYDKYRQVGLL